MLILDVRVAIEPEHEHALNEWYYTHVPRLVSLPGYASGRRYVSLTKGPRYAALYEIEHPSFLPSLLGADEHRRHPLTLSEWAAWDERFVPHMTHGTTDLYESADASWAGLVGDAPIVEFRFDGDADAVGAFCDGELLPSLQRSDTVITATRLEAATQAEVQWLGTRPRNLLLVHAHDEAAAIELADGGEVPAALQKRGVADEIESVAYWQIARHWHYIRR